MLHIQYINCYEDIIFGHCHFCLFSLSICYIIINLLRSLCQPQFGEVFKIFKSRIIKNVFVFVAQGLALSVRQPSFRLRVSHYSQ